MSVNKKKLKKWCLDLVVVILVCIAIVSGYKVLTAVGEYSKNRKEYSDIKEQMILVPEVEEEDDGYLRFDFNGLMRVNSDFKFWIDIPGTSISYPVVQASNNDYYLRRTFSGQYNVGGVIFLDYRDADDLTGRNTVIYGHRMNDGSMFTDLKKFIDANFSLENDEIRLYTKEAIYIYKVFAACKTDAYSDCYDTSFSSDEAFEKWISRQVARSYVNFDRTPTAENHIITMSTCVGSWDEYGRYVVQAMLTDIILQADRG